MAKVAPGASLEAAEENINDRVASASATELNAVNQVAAFSSDVAAVDASLKSGAAKLAALEASARNSWIAKRIARLSPRRQARLAAALRIGVVTLCVAFGSVAAVCAELYSPELFHVSVCEEAHCANESAIPMQTIFFKVRRTGSEWDDYDAVCDLERTTGDGGCNGPLLQYSDFVAFGSVLRQPYAPAGSLFSSTSTLAFAAPNLGLLRSATLGAYDYKPLLAVEFIFDADDATTRALEGPELAHKDVPLIVQSALAYRVATNAGIAHEGNRIVATEPSSSDGDTYCWQLYQGQGSDRRAFGLHGASDLQSALALGYTGCAPSTAAMVGRKTATSVILFWAFSLLLGFAFGTLVVASLVSALSSRFTLLLAAEMPAAFPGVALVAAQEGVPVDQVVRRSATLFMLLESAQAGDLADNFRDPLSGLKGAAVQGLFVLSVPVPLIVNCLFFARDEPMPLIGGPLLPPFLHVTALPAYLSLFHYLLQLVHAVLYYTKCLPLGFRRGVLMRGYEVATLIIIWLSIGMTFYNVLWLVSSIYYKPGYVINLLSIIGSGAYGLYTTVRTVGRFAQLIEQQVLEARHRVGGGTTSVKSSAKALHATKKQLTVILAGGGALLVGTAVFVLVSSSLWKASSSGVSYSSALLPLVVFAQQFQASGVLRKGEQQPTSSSSSQPSASASASGASQASTSGAP